MKTKLQLGGEGRESPECCSHHKTWSREQELRELRVEFRIWGEAKGGAATNVSILRM
jgi:hypothetical protein